MFPPRKPQRNPIPQDRVSRMRTGWSNLLKSLLIRLFRFSCRPAFLFSSRIFLRISWLLVSGSCLSRQSSSNSRRMPRTSPLIKLSHTPFIKERKRLPLFHFRMELIFQAQRRHAIPSSVSMRSSWLFAPQRFRKDPDFLPVFSCDCLKRTEAGSDEDVPSGCLPQRYKGPRVCWFSYR